MCCARKKHGGSAVFLKYTDSREMFYSDLFSDALDGEIWST
jgi:hypothetical protein